MRCIIFACCLYLSSGFECYTYTKSIPNALGTMSKEIRPLYLSKLCSTISACHATPLLNNYEEYKSDVIHCYRSALFNFNTNIFEFYKLNITRYIEFGHKLKRITHDYDAWSVYARDNIIAVLDTIRLRDSYLREFRYTRAKTIFGDINLQLQQKCRRFSIDAHNQLETTNSYSLLIEAQLNETTGLNQKLSDLDIRYNNANVGLEMAEIEFEKIVEIIQKNVVDSLLIIQE